MDYIDLIREKRLAAHLSQNALAKQIGIEQSFMNEIESRKKSPSLKVLFSICQALGITEIPVPEKTDS